MKKVLTTLLVLVSGATTAHADLVGLSQASRDSIKQCLVDKVLADKKISDESYSLLMTLIARKVGVISNESVDQIASVASSCDDFNSKMTALMGNPQFKQDLISKSVQGDRTIKRYVQMNPNRGNCENTEFLGTSMSAVEGLEEIEFDSRGQLVLSSGVHGMAGLFDAIILNMAMVRLEIATNKKVAAMIKSVNSADCRGLESTVFQNLDLFKENGPFFQLNISNPQQDILESLAEVLVK